MGLQYQLDPYAASAAWVFGVVKNRLFCLFQSGREKSIHAARIRAH